MYLFVSLSFSFSSNNVSYSKMWVSYNPQHTLYHTAHTHTSTHADGAWQQGGWGTDGNKDMGVITEEIW